MIKYEPADPVKENVIPATCVKTGSYDSVYYCKICGIELLRTLSEIPKSDEHIPGAEKESVKVPATCVEEGTKVFSVNCTLCEKLLSFRFESIPATGHVWDEGKETKAATLEAEGETTFTCTICGTTKTEPIEKLQPVAIKDDTTDVVVSFAPEAFDKDVELKVQEVSGSTVVLTDQYQSMKVYNIAAFLGEEKIQPTAPVTVRIPVPQGFDAATIAVFHIGDDGKQEQLKITVENGYIVFSVDSFSHFVVVDTATKADFTPGDVDGNGKVEASDARCILRVSVRLDPFG